jgi:hypothetical protein
MLSLDYTDSDGYTDLLAKNLELCLDDFLSLWQTRYQVVCPETLAKMRN